MQTTIMFKTDKKLKDAAQKTAKTMGIPLSAVLNQGLRDFVANRIALFSDGTALNPRTRSKDQSREL